MPLDAMYMLGFVPRWPALPVAQEVGSQRTLGELARLPEQLRPWHRRSVVRETVRELTLAVG